MQTIITRTAKHGKTQYTLPWKKSLLGEANWTLLGLWLQEISVKDKMKCLFMLKQTNWLIKILNLIPPLSFFTFTPFKCFRNEILCGSSKRNVFDSAFSFKIENSVYELREHSNNYGSLMKNDIQIALYKRDTEAVMGHTKYFVDYDAKQELSLILLFCAFKDTVFHKSRGSIDFVKYEKSYVISDPFPERISWQPDN
jgi:hypothetical protein